MNTQLPFRPFSLDGRKIVDSENKHKHMEFLTTFLGGVNMKRYGQWLKDITLKELLNINDVFWDGLEEDIDWENGEAMAKPAGGE